MWWYIGSPGRYNFLDQSQTSTQIYFLQSGKPTAGFVVDNECAETLDEDDDPFETIDKMINYLKSKYMINSTIGRLEKFKKHIMENEAFHRINYHNHKLMKIKEQIEDLKREKNRHYYEIYEIFEQGIWEGE